MIRNKLNDPRDKTRNVYRVDEFIWAGEYPGFRGPVISGVSQVANGSTHMPLLGDLVVSPLTKVQLFIDLTREDESWNSYKRGEGRGRTGLFAYDSVLPKGVLYMRYPIRDVSVPTVDFMYSILDQLLNAYEQGIRTYVHCRGGIGRTGTVIGCYLAEKNGYHGAIALNEMAALRTGCRTRFSPETGEQVDFVRSWRSPHRSYERKGK